MVGFQSAATSDWLGEEATFGGGSKFNDQNSNLSSAKLRWRMLKSPDQLWDKVLWMKYGDPLALVPKRGNISQIWRGIQAASKVLHEGIDRGPHHVADPPQWILCEIII